MTSFFKRFLFACLFMVLPLSAFAQVDATVSLTPSNPGPYQQVVLTLVSYSFDVNGATITWKTAGKTLLSGLGAKKLTVTTGASGQAIPITYSVVTFDGLTLTGSVTLSPQSVDLIYEAKESYVPAFYEGRSLPGEGSVVRITALPSISGASGKIAASNLSYTWYMNGEVLEQASGVGRSVATIALDYLTNATDIRVLVRSPNGATAEKTVSIYPHTTMPLLYPYDEILGTDLSRTYWRRLETSGDITLAVEPFYLSSRGTLSSSANYSWYLDGLPVTPEEKTILSLRPQADSTGTKTLSVVVENAKRRLQKAQNDLEIIFDTRR